MKPEVKRRPFDNQRIADKDYEAGLYLGMMNIEGFGVAPVVSLRVARHLSAWHFLEATVGQARPADGGFNDNTGARQRLSASNRTFRYANLVYGYNAVHGEMFVRPGKAYNNQLYFVGGLGSTRFAGDDHLTFVGGVGYRLMIKDSWAVHIDVRDHFLKAKAPRPSEWTNNVEVQLGASVLF